MLLTDWWSGMTWVGNFGHHPTTRDVIDWLQHLYLQQLACKRIKNLKTIPKSRHLCAVCETDIAGAPNDIIGAHKSIFEQISLLSLANQSGADPWKWLGAFMAAVTVIVMGYYVYHRKPSQTWLHTLFHHSSSFLRWESKYIYFNPNPNIFIQFQKSNIFPIQFHDFKGSWFQPTSSHKRPPLNMWVLFGRVFVFVFVFVFVSDTECQHLPILVGVNTGCQHWVPTLGVSTYQYI